MTRPPRKHPVPTLEDFAAALPLAEVDSALQALAAWNAQLHQPEAVAPRKTADRPKPTLSLKGDPS